VTHEDEFRETRKWLSHPQQAFLHSLPAKFFYLSPCEYCFIHYVAAIFIALANFKLLAPGLRG
jgi:hypothetical protein